jgi:CheY-like chemotaxis protein
MANRTKDEFLAMLGHELRNPLGAVASAISFLNLTAPDERTARPREIISRQMGHLTRLVDDLLDVGRLTSGRIELQPTIVDLGKLVDECMAALSTRAPKHRLQVATMSVLVRGDPARLEQIVTNLLDNAVKYTPPGGAIWVGVSQVDSRAVLRVRDSGIGIASDLLPRVFDLFTQGERSLDRSRGGLGLGLAVVHRLVMLHGGHVSVESAGPDRGSEFVVQLPVAEAGSMRSPASEAVPLLRSYRVLVVEDYDDARESLRLLLAAEGHTVRVAADGIEGFEILRTWRPDVALVDVGLPGLDGYGFARAVGADPEIGQTPLVALTGYGQPEDRRQATEAGFRAHLVKPVFREALLRTLAAVVAKDN